MGRSRSKLVQQRNEMETRVKIILLCLSVLCVGCGSATLGPLSNGGLDARIALRAEVDLLRLHGTVNTGPLDALVDVEQAYTGTSDSNLIFESRVTVSIVNIEGLVAAPNIVVNGKQLVYTSHGKASISILNMDTTMTVQFTWPDTVITATYTLLSESSLGARARSYTSDWSKSTPLPIASKGTRSDSVVYDFGIYAISYVDFHVALQTSADTGSFAVPSKVADSVQTDNKIFVSQYRSYYTTHELNAPTSGYGNRVIGVLQRCRVSYVLRVVP